MTQLSDLVVSQTLAEQLKAAGFDQSSTIHLWTRNTATTEWFVIQTGQYNTRLEVIAAPTSDELLAVLPEGMYIISHRAGQFLVKNRMAPPIELPLLANRFVEVLGLIYLDFEARGRIRHKEAA
jgi:hypothetical protein